jgi:hypothetical protein
MPADSSERRDPAAYPQTHARPEDASQSDASAIGRGAGKDDWKAMYGIAATAGFPDHRGGLSDGSRDISDHGYRTGQ